MSMEKLVDRIMAPFMLLIIGATAGLIVAGILTIIGHAVQPAPPHNWQISAYIMCDSRGGVFAMGHTNDGNAWAICHDVGPFVQITDTTIGMDRGE